MKTPVLLGCMLAVTSCYAQEAAISSCTNRIAIKAGDYAHALVTTTDATGKPVMAARHTLGPEFFSFNLEWLEFQAGLWDPTLKDASGAVVGGVRAEAVKYLKTNFPGAYYRYPGGSNSNYFDWSVAVGPMAARPIKKQVTWANPLVTRFGPDEYLKFVRDVGGQGWYVANLFGTLKADGTGVEQPGAILAASAGKLAAYMKKARDSGMPAVQRWELGNELDRAPISWQPEKINANAAAVQAAVLANDPGAKFVSFMQEYPALPTVTMSTFNLKVATSLKTSVSDFAMHLYYDGEPNGQPINQKFFAVCRAINSAKSAGVANPTIWVTEHARVPPGAFAKADWSDVWPQTADITAAIGVADFVLAAALTPEVKGNFLHAMHAARGPWPTFHQALTVGGEVYPSAVSLALAALRGTMLPVVLESATTSKNVAAYGGGYDFRAVTMSDVARSKFAVWAINRSTSRISVKFKLPSLKSKILAVAVQHVNKVATATSNSTSKTAVQAIKETVTLRFDVNGEATVVLNPESISTFSIDPLLTAK